MRIKLGEIGKWINGEIIGDENLWITGFSGIKEAKEGELTFVAHSKYIPLIEKTQASAVITPRDIEGGRKPIVRTDNPSLAFTKVLSRVTKDHRPQLKGIHSTAVIAQDAKIGKNAAIGPYTVIEKGAEIGDNTFVYSGCYVGHHTRIGKDCLIYPSVVIRENIQIGERVIIHSCTVVGSDGFGFINVKGVHEKIPQIGTVEIHDDVEIGANVTIDRARFDKTIIGRGTKIDNLVQIAHNVRIGENCIIVSQVGISGSCILEDNVILAGQVGLAGHITIGSGSVVAAGSGVPNSVPPQTTVWGYPSKPIRQAKRVNASVQRLPQTMKSINELKKRIEELESRLPDQ